jgi:hypothetical protein
MQIVVLDPNTNSIPILTESDVFILRGLFDEKNTSLYNDLLNEIENAPIKGDQSDLWKAWHGETHLIADDHLNWKKSCPTFNMIIKRISDYFDMDVKATRFNLYEDLRDFKPMHFDAAAIDPKKAETQNITIGITFGYTRSIEFEHAKTRARISFPLNNGVVYGFGKDININWRHGIPPIKPEIIEQTNNLNETGRISIIAWGKTNQIKLY